MKIVGQTTERKTEDKAKKLALKKANKKEATNVANEELRGLNACVRFLNSDKGKEALNLLGIQLSTEATKIGLLKTFEAIDEAKVERSKFSKDELVKKGSLVLLMKDGSKRKAFNNTQIFAAAKKLA